MSELYNQFLEAFSLSAYDVPMIGVGLTFFFFLYKILELKVFLPAIEHIEQRESATIGSAESAVLMRQKATALKERYERELFEARLEANKQRIEIVSRAKNEAQNLINGAESEIANLISKGRMTIQDQIRNCQTKANSEAKQLAELLIKKVDSELSTH